MNIGLFSIFIALSLRHLQNNIPCCHNFSITFVNLVKLSKYASFLKFPFFSYQKEKKRGIILNSMDIESKKFLGQPKSFVSIFNTLLFDGQPVLKPEYLKDENSELVMNVSSKHVDIIKRYEDGTYLDLFVIESQSYVDPSMAVRVMEYESVARMRYIRQCFKKHVPMHTRLPMILTVVLFVGESKWNAAKRLS